MNRHARRKAGQHKQLAEMRKAEQHAYVQWCALRRREGKSTDRAAFAEALDQAWAAHEERLAKQAADKVAT